MHRVKPIVATTTEKLAGALGLSIGTLRRRGKGMERSARAVKRLKEIARRQGITRGAHLGPVTQAASQGTKHRDLSRECRLTLLHSVPERCRGFETAGMFQRKGQRLPPDPTG